jgi:dihydroflavonol-4-reductase
VTVTGPAFVTGGSGFVGGALLARLVADGREVRALARSAEASSSVEAAGARPVRGDLFDVAALLEGMRGCVTVFHVAGVNAMCVKDPRNMLHTNVEGSDAVVRAAAAVGARRLVLTSSAATIGEATGVVGREDTPHRGTFLSEYERSKFLAEQRVLAVAEELDIEVVRLNPSSVQGPGRTGGSARILFRLVDARLPFIVDTHLSIVDIDDCTQAHISAESRGTPGQRYVVSGASLTTRRTVELVRAVAGRPRRVIRLPRGVVSAAGALASGFTAVTGRSTPFCTELARTLLHGHRYDGSLATRELGLNYRPIEDTIERTLRWCADLGLIRPLQTGGVP